VRKIAKALILAIWFASAGIGAATAASVGEVTGLPVPRFVSVAADVANLRLGPRRSYDVVAIYRRRGLPLKIVGEFDNWREVIDFEGQRGWMHASLLSGRRTVIVWQHAAVLRRGPAVDAPAIARVAPSVVATLLTCEDGEAGGWCFVDIAGRRGWLAREGLWGVEVEAHTN